MKYLKLKNLLVINSFFFFFFIIFFFIFPKSDIHFSHLFFENNFFISEKYPYIKTLRSFLKDLMVIISIISLVILIVYNFKIFNKGANKLNKRLKFSIIGLIIGPIIGSGLIANWYFKDQWGRARPIQVKEFGGEKEFTRAFLKTDQCKKNCSWISGESSAAFSFLAGTLILKHPLFFFINLFFGLVVSFCRISMGGHFLSDNLFALFFMLYLAIAYKYFVIKIIKRVPRKNV
jgi:lipid A 4'-phosphatase